MEIRDIRVGDGCIETDDHSIMELDLIRIDWIEAIKDISIQLRSAREAFDQTGDIVDPGWLNDARHAKNKAQANLARLEVEIKCRNILAEAERKAAARERRAQKAQANLDQSIRFEREFFNVVCESVSKDQFSLYIERTKTRIQESK